MPKIRLVKVAVQPYFVLDDGKIMTEVEHPPTVIPAAEWPTYSSERFPAELEEWQARLDAEMAGTPGGGIEKPKPNRAARRAKR